jgi:mono/diheme cytochrome c family protein
MTTAACSLLALASALALAPSPAGAADGAEVYRRRCASCHGAGGAKKLPPLSSPLVQSRSDADLFAAVARGTADRKMPAFRGKLADAEIAAVVGYLRTLKP